MIRALRLAARGFEWLTQPRSIAGVAPDRLTNAQLDQIALESFKSCRQLIIENIKIMERNESFVIGAIGAIITFSIGRSNPVFSAQYALIPTILLLGYWRYSALKQVIDLADDFTVEAEKLSALGWTTFYRDRRSGSLGHSRRAFWFVLGVLAAIYLTICFFHGPYLHADPVSFTGLQMV